jgi:hypothetical protein
MTNIKDALGQRGEIIFSVLISKFHSSGEPLFIPQFLGDKWPLVDFIVELVGAGSTVPYFFVQVRTTREGYTKKDKRLKVSVPAQKVRLLALHPAPTYIAGIDEINEAGFIVSANGEHLKGMSSMSTAFPINTSNREALWNEVKDYWGKPSTPKFSSGFIDVNWR